MFRTTPLILLRAALLAVVLRQSASAQVIQSREPKLFDQFVFGLSLFGGLPLGEFKEHEDGGGGGELAFGFQPFRREPLLIRANVGALVYGRYNRNVQDEWCDLSACYEQTVFYDARYHNMTLLQAGPEITATDGRWRPFAFAMAGVTFFNSWANYGQADFSGSPPSRSLHSSSNFSTAYGGGVRLVGSGLGRANGLELSLRVTRNAKASYLTDEGVFRRPDGSYDVSPRTGAANVLTIHVGWWVGPHVLWSER